MTEYFFRDVLTIKNGRNQKKVENPNGKYPIYGSGGIMGYADNFLCDAGTVIIGRKGTINKPLYIDEPFWNVDTAFGLCANQEILFPKYLYYFCENYNFERLSTTVTIPSLTKANLLNIKISLPPLSEQKRIAAILDKVDSIIRKRKQSIRLLDELVKAKFVEMFGDTKSNSKNLPLIELGDIADVRSSKRVYTTDFKGDGIPFYRGTEIGLLAENKDFNPELFISQKHYRSLCKAAGRPQIGDLLLPSICHDGRIWEIDTEKPFYFKDGRVLWVNSIKSCFDVTYLRYALKFRLIVDYDKFASGTTFSELKICTLKKCRIFAVSISKQKQFSSFAKKVESLSDENKRFIKGNYNLKYSLDSQFFR